MKSWRIRTASLGRARSARPSCAQPRPGPLTARRPRACGASAAAGVAAVAAALVSHRSRGYRTFCECEGYDWTVPRRRQPHHCRTASVRVPTMLCEARPEARPLGPTQTASCPTRRRTAFVATTPVCHIRVLGVHEATWPRCPPCPPQGPPLHIQKIEKVRLSFWFYLFVFLTGSRPWRTRSEKELLFSHFFKQCFRESRNNKVIVWTFKK